MTIPTSPILFLDFDGVICTTAAYVAFRQHDDPVACGLIKKLCDEHNCRIVVTSTWRNGDKALPLLAAHHLLDYLHDDWKVESQNESRSRAIINWLNEHPEHTEYIIIDDERCDYTVEQKKWFVHIDMYEGFGLRDFQLTEHYLEQFDFNGKLDAFMDRKPYVRLEQKPRITLQNMANDAISAINEGDLDRAKDLLDLIANHPLAA